MGNGEGEKKVDEVTTTTPDNKETTSTTTPEKKDETKPDAKELDKKNLEAREKIVALHINNKLLSLLKDMIANKDTASDAAMSAGTMLLCKNILTKLVTGQEDDVSGFKIFAMKQVLNIDLVKEAQEIQTEIAIKDPSFATANLKQEVQGNNTTPTKTETPSQDGEDGYLDDAYDDFAGDIDGIKYSDMISLDSIKSHGAIIEKGMTYCSRTVVKDMKQIFDIDLAAGNAVTVQNTYDKNDIGVKKTGYEIQSVSDEIPSDPTQYGGLKGDVFDIFTKSNSENGKKFGHRCRGFRSLPSGKMYVVDYYIKGMPKKPVPLEDYVEKVCKGMNRPITKIVGFGVDKQIVDNAQVKLVAKQNAEQPLANAA